MNEVLQITSSDLIDDIETPFRVQAGPGSGKTYWLVRHVRQVLEKSKRLRAGQKVACISYTNVAVEELQDDLHEIGVRGDEVEVSTIHSFLYRNVVRPYLHLLKEQNGKCLVNHAEVDGHDEHRTSYRRIKGWLSSLGKKNRFDTAAWSERLETFRWAYGVDGWEPKVRPSWNDEDRYIPTTKLDRYKPSFWKKGIIHHEDVLYFAHRILDENEGLKAFLSARFPYLFIDEFQDTGFTQAQLTRWLADEGTIVGVIGDSEQSIYEFRGARPEELQNFNVPALKDYAIATNRRSTPNIVEFLNLVRSDGLAQESLADVEDGAPIECLVGPQEDVGRVVMESAFNEELAILAYQNDVVSAFRRHALGGPSVQKGIWKKFREMDSNLGRVTFIHHALSAARLAEDGKLGLAIREMQRGIRVRNSELRPPFRCQRPVSALERRALAMSMVQFFAGNMSEWRAQTLLDVYSTLQERMKSDFEHLSVTGYGSGKTKDFADGHRVGELYDAVALAGGGETHPIRTIHKSKGAEFEHVLVWFSEQAKLKATLSKRPSKEKRRYYVGMSRARQRLVLGLPELDEEVEREIGGRGIRVRRLDA